MTATRQKRLRKIAVEHYFKPGCYPSTYEDWIEGHLDECDRCLSEARIDKDVIELYDLLVKITEPDHVIALAARAYVNQTPYLDKALADPGFNVSALEEGKRLWDVLVATVKGAP